MRHLRKLANHLLDVELHCLRLREAGAGNAQRMHGEVLFIQGRDEFLTEAEKQQQRAQKQNHAGRDCGEGPVDGAFQERRVGGLEAAHCKVIGFLHPACNSDGDECRNEREGKNES